MTLWVDKMGALKARRGDYKSIVKVSTKAEKLIEVVEHPVDAVAYLSSWLTKETGLLYCEDFYWDHTDDDEMVWIFIDPKIATLFKIVWG